MRYYDVRRPRRWIGRAVGIVALAVAGVGGYFVGSRVLSSTSADATDVAQVSGTDIQNDSPDPDPRPITTTALHIESVAMVGDSITKASTDSLRYDFTASGIAKADIDAEVGRRIEVGDGKGTPLNGIAVLTKMLASNTKPDVWVVALGTNDAGLYATPDDYTRLIDTVVGMLPANAPLVWVDVYRPDHVDGAREFNDRLHRALDGRKHTAIVDWFTKASAPGQRILRGDHIHPNADGVVVFAGLVDDAIASLR